MTVNKGSKNESWEDLFWEPHKYNERIKLKSGTYLHSTCPHCDGELTKKDVLTLEVINPENEIGIIELSPYLDSFERKTNIKLPDNKEVIDLRCPLCHKSLVIKKFWVSAASIKVPFYICTRSGCQWHAISAEEENKILLDNSDEW
jgi:hypothetical protein